MAEHELVRPMYREYLAGSHGMGFIFYRGECACGASGWGGSHKSQQAWWRRHFRSELRKRHG